jgi:hypothetical protein
VIGVAKPITRIELIAYKSHAVPTIALEPNGSFTGIIA